MVTPVFVERFDDATLEAGITANNSPAISGGAAFLGDAATQNPDAAGAARGYSHDGSGIYLDAAGITTSVVLETVLAADIATPNAGETLFSIGGVYGVNIGSSGLLRIILQDGPVPYETSLSANPVAGDHVGLVITDKGAGAVDVVDLYINGTLGLRRTLLDTHDGLAGTITGIGLETHSAVPYSRGLESHWMQSRC